MPTKERKRERFHELRVHGVTVNGIFVDESELVRLSTATETIAYGNAKLAVHYNSCHHSLKEWSHFMVTNDVRYLDTGIHLSIASPSVFWMNQRPYGLPYAFDLAVKVEELVTDPQLNFRAVKAMWPKLPKGVSIPNFIIELGDLTKLFDYWARRRSFLDNIANGTLNIEFGWRPFIDDIITTLKYIATFKKKLKKFLAGYHIPHVRHYRRSLFDDEGGGGSPLPTVPKNLQITEDHLNTTCDFHPFPNDPSVLCAGYFKGGMSLFCQHLVLPEYCATMKFTYYSPQLLQANGELLAMLDAFRIKWDAGIIWDAIPFSFVVDWFFDVGNWLSSFLKVDNYKVYVRIIDFCVSTKVDVRAHGTFTVTADDTDPHDVGLLIYPWTDRYRSYRRIATTPVLVDPSDGFKNPLKDLERVILALALGKNCSRPRKRHTKFKPQR